MALLRQNLYTFRQEVNRMTEPLLKMKGISKHFSTTVALDAVDLNVYPGEIRGLIGENGSGKSTISSIAAGMQKADAGTMEFKGKPWTPTDMVDALQHGIGMVVQEQGTVPGITVAENIFLGQLDGFRHGPFIDRKALMQKAKEILALVGMENIDPAMPLGALDLQDRKLVEIAKVIAKKPEIFVVDETTTALSQTGRDTIYRLMREQKAAERSVLFISHDLEELMEVCDSLTVLRDGKLIRSLQKDEFDAELIKQLMVGRELKGDYYRSDFDPACGEKVVLELQDGENAALHGVNIQLHEGEILGIGGLSSCGMHDLGKVLFGAQPLQGGQLHCGKEKVSDTRTAIHCHIGYVSKDRDVEALNLNASIKDNISVAALDALRGPGPFILAKTERAHVEEQRKELSIKCRSIEQRVAELSGGNKQKVVFGKWIGAGSDILILDCPTRGVDIGVKQAMYQLIYKLKKEGKSFILISEELAELIGMSDRLLMMKDGKITQEFTRSESLQEADLIGAMI